MNTRHFSRRLLLLCLSGSLACSDSAGGTDDLGAGDLQTIVDAPSKRTFGGDRPVALQVPTGIDLTQPTPLVFVLHGFGANGFVQERLLGYNELAQKEGFLLASPNGTANKNGHLFWNATPACCDKFGDKPDDVGYLTGLIDEITAAGWPVDPKRVFLIGHSNGAYMAHRMACDRSSRIAAIISLAGSTFIDPKMCQPTQAVSVLQLHGDQDSSVLYDGDSDYPGAIQTAQLWAGYNGCGADLSPISPNFDLDSKVAGPETVVERAPGCPKGIDVELWTMKGVGHVPNPTPQFASRTWAFFVGHPKP